MENIKRQKGITLIALVVTIVIMLILAIVAIAGITNNDLIKHVENAVEIHEAKQDEEQGKLDEFAELIKQELEGNTEEDTEEDNNDDDDNNMGNTIIGHICDLSTDYSVNSNGDGTHIVEYVCSDYPSCTEKRFVTEECEPVELDWQCNGNGTHSILYAACGECGGGDNTTETEDCYDNNNDHSCDKCSFDLSCSHPNASISYGDAYDDYHMEGGYCADCDSTWLEPAGHSYVESGYDNGGGDHVTGKHFKCYECEECKYVKKVEEDCFDYSEGDNDPNGICDGCGSTMY